MTVEKLRFGRDGRFRILMVSDFHAGRNCNPKLVEGLEALLQATTPDFVMLGGDQCLDKETPEEVGTYFSGIMAPVIRRGLPWGVIFGNHDREMGIDVHEEMRVYESMPGCMAEAGDEALHGVGNYCLPVYDAAGKTVRFHLWALDSNRYTKDYVPMFGLSPDTRFLLPDHFNDGCQEATVLFDQIRWYYETSESAEKENGRKIPGVMFMHIPLPEYLQITRNPEECGAIGHKRDTIGCTELNSGLFLACLERGDIRGIFFGHEHLTDLKGEYCGVTMACDAALGFNMSCHDDLRGGRVIDLYEKDDTVETYTVKLMELMGRGAMRDPAYFEGGCKYHIRKL
ncbi:MAG: metallophosphoesterase [Clostridia bacterium]|nr:metallophosphoesterase [Clostridia bacterium]